MKKDESIILNDQSEAALIGSILMEEDIPHYIRSYADAAYDGIHQIQMGWGRVETPLEYRDRVLDILKGLRESEV